MEVTEDKTNNRQYGYVQGGAMTLHYYTIVDAKGDKESENEFQ
jgi:hypothetical protein